MSAPVCVFPPELLFHMFTKYSTHEVVPVIRLVCKSLLSDVHSFHEYITSSAPEVLLEAVTRHHDEFTLRMCMVLKRFDIILNYLPYFDVVYGYYEKGISYGTYRDAIYKYQCEGLIRSAFHEVCNMHDSYRYRSFEQTCSRKICCA